MVTRKRFSHNSLYHRIRLPVQYYKPTKRFAQENMTPNISRRDLVVMRAEQNSACHRHRHSAITSDDSSSRVDTFGFKA
jgi:hypothetical protein